MLFHKSFILMIILKQWNLVLGFRGTMVYFKISISFPFSRRKFFFSQKSKSTNQQEHDADHRHKGGID